MQLQISTRELIDRLSHHRATILRDKSPAISKTNRAIQLENAKLTITIQQFINKLLAQDG